MNLHLQNDFSYYSLYIIFYIYYIIFIFFTELRTECHLIKGVSIKVKSTDPLNQLNCKNLLVCSKKYCGLLIVGTKWWR